MTSAVSGVRRLVARGRQHLVDVPGGWPVLATVCGWTGAVAARPISPAVIVAAGVVVILGRRRVPGAVWCCVAIAVVCNVSATRALAGLDDLGDGDYRGMVTLVTDPEPVVGDGWRFEADSDVGHVLVEVSNPTAGAVVADLLAGQRIDVVGRTEPFSRVTAWTRSRHLVGVLDVASVSAIGEAAPPVAIANRYRAVLERGADSLPDRQRSLLAGLVIGDDRAQPPELTADFRASGLTHLLAVSGQNLVFVLAVGMPLLRRLRLWPRFTTSVTLVAAFATVTRFEPSVVRAAAVAAVALFATTIGRPRDGVRHLALAICGLLVTDPLLVHSLGFRLSVAASVGVLVLAPSIVHVLPGPRWFREGFGVTAGAQLAVAPVLVPSLGPMPVAALPANVLAGPIAGLVMVWGLTAGTVAGVVGGEVATALHVPTRAALSTLEWVARWAAGLPLGHVDLRHVVVVAVAAGLWRWRPTARSAAAVLAVTVIVAAAVTPVPNGERQVGFDTTIWVDGPVAVILAGPRARPADVLDDLRRSQVRSVGLLIVRSGRADQLALIEAVEARFPVGAVVGPPGPGLAELVSPPAGTRIRVARLVVAVDDVGPPMRVRVGWR